MGTTKTGWEGRIANVKIGATPIDGGTRTRTYTLGGDGDLPLLGVGEAAGSVPLVAYDICDDPALWPDLLKSILGDKIHDPAELARRAEHEYGADIIRLNLTSTRRKDSVDTSALKRTIEEVLSATGLPLIIEGSADPVIDSEVFLLCGEVADGENVLLGTAEADRYRSVAAAAVAYHHGVIAQSPIDANLAKQLNILLHEVGVSQDRIVIDPYTGALGYGLEYSYSVMERIRYAALKGDRDLASPMISASPDALNVKEVRVGTLEERSATGCMWEYTTALATIVAGAEVVVVRHPGSVPLLKKAVLGLTADSAGRGE